MNKYIKFLIAGLMIAAGVYLMMNRQIGWGIVVVFFSLSPILLFFKNETFRWNHAVGFCFLILAVYFIFKR